MASKLLKKYKEKSSLEKSKLSQLLKRKRIESGMTLEEVSDGVCSTSYLSKIENCLVDVDDQYYQLLFEKLNIEYSAVLNNRLVPTYQESINAYLKNDLLFIEKHITSIIKNNLYCETEIDLFILFYNVIKHNFDEASELINRIELVFNTLSNEEKQFFSFLNALYYQELGNYELLEIAINNLFDLNIQDEILNIAFTDLLLDFYFYIKDAALYFNYNEKIANQNVIVNYNRIYYKHELQATVLKYKDYNSAQMMERLKTDKENADLYSYYNLYYLYLTNNYIDAIDLVKEIKLTNESVVLYGLVLDELQEPNLFYEFLNNVRVKNEKIDGKEKVLIEYFKLKFKQTSYSYLLNYCKQYLLGSPEVVERSIEYLYLEREYIRLCFETGHYKDVVKYFMNKRKKK